MHQMGEVSFYFRQVRPYIREITNAPTIQQSSFVAARVASDLASLTDPFFQSMAAAVALFSNDTASCNPLESITESEWLALTECIANSRIGVTEAMRHYMQIANGLAAQASKVELSVLVAEQSQLLQDLVQGQKLENKPAPPTQQMLDKFISVTNMWNTFSVGLEEAVRQTTIPEVDVALQISLQSSLLQDLNDAMDLQVQAGAAAGSTVQIRLLDLTHRQQFQFHNFPIQVYKVLFGAIPAEELNTTAQAFRSLHRELIMGAPATDERMALQKITDLCIVRGLAEVMDNYYQLERACFQIVNNESDAVSIVNQVSPAGIAAMASSSSDIYNFYQGQPASCENITLAKGDWELLMSEVTLLAGLAEDAMTAVISQTITVEMTALRDSMDRLVMGSPHPLVPVQPTQALFDRIINQLQPLVETFLEADPTYQVVAPQGTSIVAQAKGLLRSYTDKALELEPGWPGQRVRVAMWQVVLAKKVYREAMAERFDVGRQLLPAEQEFETAHQQLKDGGDGFAAIIDEREDLLSGTALGKHGQL